MDRWMTLLLVSVFAVPSTFAAVDPGASTIAMEGPVNDVGVSQTGGWVGGVSDDPGGLFDLHAIVYSLHGLSSQNPIRGSLDPPECDDDIGVDSCVHDGLAIAVSGDGKTVAAGSHIGTKNGADRGSVVVIDDGHGAVRFSSTSNGQGTKIEGRITDIDISDSGNTIAVGTVVNPNLNPTGRIYVFDGGANPRLNPLEPYETAAGVTDIDVSPDGAWISAAAGSHYRIQKGGNMYTYTETGAAAATVDVSGHTTAWSIAGFADSPDGIIVLYSSLHSNANSKLDHRIFGAADQPAVSITRDASRFAFSIDGGFRIFTLDPIAGTVPTPLDQITGVGTVTDLAFSGDGRYLAVAAGNDIRLYHIGSEARQVWKHTATNALGSLDIDSNGDTLVTAHGDDITVYRADHDLDLNLIGALPNIQPGNSRELNLEIRNTGNRVEDVRLSSTSPNDWFVNLEPNQFDLRADNLRSIATTVTVPPATPPGSYDVAIEAAAAGRTSTLTVPVTVPAVEAWTLQLVGSGSLDASATAPATFVVKVTNVGNTAGSTGVQVSSLSPGWTAATTPSTVQLSPGSSQDVEVRVSAPANSAQLASTSPFISLTADAAQRISVTATVGAQYAIGLDVPSGVQVPAGGTKPMVLTIRNDGNAPDSFRVSLGALPAGWNLAFQNGVKEAIVQGLGPGESQVLSVTIEAPDSDVGTQAQLSIIGTSIADAQQRSTRNVILSIAEAEDPDNGTPGLPALLLIAALLGVAARRRNG